jgi:predicted ATPase
MRRLSAPADYVVGGELYERADALAGLCAALELGAAGRGQIVLVSGETGVGKTALVQRSAREVAGTARILWGGCDPLFTPRPLGPFLDIAAQIEGEFAEIVAKDGRPFRVLPALLRELGSGRAIVVVEDLHWADEASLDLLGLVARRIGQVPAVVVMTFRDDEIGPAHRLRALLGSLATAPAVTRIRLEPLSREAVAVMAKPHGVDERQLFERTGGNPFFITEVLASGATGVPPTVRDAVLARAARPGKPPTAGSHRDHAGLSRIRAARRPGRDGP